MQARDVTEADEWLGICPDSGKVDVRGDSVGAGTTDNGNDRPHAGISKRLVEVVEPVLVAACHESH
jgi:hypothetical protein